MNTRIIIATALVVCSTLAVVTFSNARPGDNPAVQTALSGLGYTTIPIRKTARNEFEVNATLNGSKPITLVISFESSHSIFNTKRLDEMGLAYEKIGRKFEVNGDEDDVYVFRSDSINIGNGKIGPEELTAIDFSEFHVFEDYRVSGILGRDFLLQYNAIVDFAGQKLYLKTS